MVVKLILESRVNVRVPAEFLRGYVREVSNWEEMGASVPVVSSLVRPPKCSWEGEPWAPGSKIIMKTGALGLGMTRRVTALQAESGEACRWRQEDGPPGVKQKITTSYSVLAVTDTDSELITRMWAEGGMSKLIPARQSSTSIGSFAASVFEQAYARHRSLTR